MNNDLLNRARKLRDGRIAKEQTSALNLEEESRAYEELRERARIASMPGHNGPDSHFAIQQDREAFDEMEAFDLSPEQEQEIGRRMGRHE